MPYPIAPGSLEPLTPDLPASITWWSEFDPSWKADIRGLAVDVERTARCAKWDARVRVSGNTPLQHAAASGTNTISVKEFRIARPPLPYRTWISSNNDHTWYGIDVAGRRYHEATALGPAIPNVPTPWRADRVRDHDLTIDYRLQRPGQTAAGLPVWPMVPSIAGLDAGPGGWDSAFAFVAAGYGMDGPVGPARGSDGTIPGHPLRCGERLRFSEAALRRLWAEAITAQDYAFLWAAERRGFILTDRTTPDLTIGHAIRLPKDRRLAITLRFRLSDLVVLAVLG